MDIQLAPFSQHDSDAVRRVVLAAFAQYQDHYQEWEQFTRRIGDIASLAENAEIIVAQADGSLAGAVGYVAPHRPKAAFFQPEWAVIRMLVVDPRYRGQGIGRQLTEACIQRAIADGASVIALHTSPIMAVAQGIYQRMGFQFAYDVPAIHGVAYGVYVRNLHDPFSPHT